MDGGRPALSLVVPADEQQPLRRRDSLQLPAKQKRLFPVACRVVPTDQWFTSRVDRTWNVIDLKLWLLSKALPTRALPLPASFRPSSPVTFASAPPPQRPPTAASYHPRRHTSPAASPATTPPMSPPASSPPPASPPVPARVGSPVPSFGSEDDATMYDSVELDADLDLDLDDDDVQSLPPSIPYSFSTGAPAISGLEALRAKAAARNYGNAAPTIDPGLVTRAENIARRWRLYSFSSGMLLADDLPLTEYSLLPYELLELHRAAAYVRLPRTLPRPPAEDPPEPPPPAPHSTARAYHSTKNRRPSPGPAPSDSDSDAADDGLLPPGGSPYAQPYFDGWVLVLGAGDALDDDGTGAAGGNEERRKTRRRARAKSEAARALKAKDREREREREWSELQKLIGNPPAPDAPRAPDDLWHRRWVVVREGLLSVWRERRDAAPEARFDVRACVALHDAEKLPSILGAAAPTSQTLPASAPIICARFRTTPDDTAPTRHRRTPVPAPAPAPWLVLQLPDAHTHEHLLRTLHRLAYAPRALRTDFLPTPIPPPLALRFGAPSPTSSSAPSSPASPAPPPRMGLGPGVGVRFPEWREALLARAARAGQGLPVEGPPAAVADADQDADDEDSGGSEAEWPAWAYDLSRPRAVRGQGERVPRTPSASLVSLREALGSAPPRGSVRRRARSVGEGDDDAPVQPPDARRPLTITTVTTTTVSAAPPGFVLPQPSPSPRLRASTVSSLPAAEELTTTSSVRTFEAGRVRGLMRGLSMRAGRDSIMRSLENALDFVDGK